MGAELARIATPEEEHAISNAEVITGIGPNWYARIRQIRATLREMGVVDEPELNARKINIENFQTYLTAMLTEAFGAIPQMQFRGVELFKDQMHDYTYVVVRFIPNGKREVISVKEHLRRFPSEELLGKIIVFS